MKFRHIFKEGNSDGARKAWESRRRGGVDDTKATWGNYNIKTTAKFAGLGSVKEWQVSFVGGSFSSKEQAEKVAERLRKHPTPAQRKAIQEGRFAAKMLPLRDHYDNDTAYEYVREWGEFSFGPKGKEQAEAYSVLLEGGEGGKWKPEKTGGHWRAHRVGK